MNVCPQADALAWLEETDPAKNKNRAEPTTVNALSVTQRRMSVSGSQLYCVGNRVRETGFDYLPKVLASTSATSANQLEQYEPPAVEQFNLEAQSEMPAHGSAAKKPRLDSNITLNAPNARSISNVSVNSQNAPSEMPVHKSPAKKPTIDLNVASTSSELPDVEQFDSAGPAEMPVLKSAQIKPTLDSNVTVANENAPNEQSDSGVAVNVLNEPFDMPAQKSVTKKPKIDSNATVNAPNARLQLHNRYNPFMRLANQPFGTKRNRSLSVDSATPRVFDLSAPLFPYNNNFIRRRLSMEGAPKLDTLQEVAIDDVGEPVGS